MFLGRVLHTECCEFPGPSSGMHLEIYWAQSFKEDNRMETSDCLFVLLFSFPKRHNAFCNLCATEIISAVNFNGLKHL